MTPPKQGTRAPRDVGTDRGQAGTGLTQHAQGLPGELEPSAPALVPAAAPGRPDPQRELGSEDEDSERFLRRATCGETPVNGGSVSAALAGGKRLAPPLRPASSWCRPDVPSVPNGKPCKMTTALSPKFLF